MKIVNERHIHSLKMVGERIAVDNPLYNGSTKDKAFLSWKCEKCKDINTFDYGPYKSILEI